MPSPTESRAWIATSADAEPDARSIGGKAWNLSRLDAWARAGTDARVPEWIALRAEAFDALVSSAAPWPRTVGEAEQRRAQTLDVSISEPLRDAMTAALAHAGIGGGALAVRSSAVGEDAGSASFAGQFDSVLGVSSEPDALWDAVRQVWASAFHPHAVAYAAQHGGAATRMAVVVQRLVDPAISGVAFSVDPVSAHADVTVVSAVYGLGEGLVSGDLDADTFRVRWSEAASGPGAAIVERTIAAKPHAVRRAPGGGTETRAVAADLAGAPALSDDDVVRIATVARQLQTSFGAPQDVEWALVDETDGRVLYVLQSRPITTLPAATPASDVPTTTGERHVWDNSNIAESYSGVTTPLTFSFAREVYEDVYRQFCALMGVEPALLESHRAVFANMLGLVRGRVYYDLINWYRTLALLPGFTFNRAFMERMMGVREALTDAPAPPSAGSRARDLWRLMRMVTRLVRESRRLRTEIPAFHARVDAALAPLAGEDLSRWERERVLALYATLENDLLRHWRAPLVNDFFAMIFFGVLGRLIERWLPGAPPTLANDLLCGEGGIISTEPARQVMALARRVASSPELAARFAAEPDDGALGRAIDSEPALAPFRAEVRAYLSRFGDRCMEELKLETVTLSEDPTFLVQMIRAYAARGAVNPDAARAHETGIRTAAEADVRARLRWPRSALFAWVLRNARARVRDRENLRFERTRVFGVVRRIFVALGADLAARGRIATARDVFWLTREELFDAARGDASVDLGPRIRERREVFDAYARGPAPPDRFETRGPAEGAALDAVMAGATDRAAPAADSILRGTGCCPGVVRARVRIVRDPREARDLDGRILVAERTDPGWTLLFPAARGLLVQRGSLLSHSAIVAREMGLPCVVGIPALLDTLVEGEEVEMDGTTGEVLRMGT